MNLRFEDYAMFKLQTMDSLNGPITQLQSSDVHHFQLTSILPYVYLIHISIILSGYFDRI